jgi:hypothetical protein
MVSLDKRTSYCHLHAVGEVAVFGYVLQNILPNKTGSICTAMTIKHLNIPQTECLKWATWGTVKFHQAWQWELISQSQGLPSVVYALSKGPE